MPVTNRCASARARRKNARQPGTEVGTSSPRRRRVLMRSAGTRRQFPDSAYKNVDGRIRRQASSSNPNHPDCTALSVDQITASSPVR